MKIRFVGIASGKLFWEVLDQNGSQCWFGAFSNCCRVMLRQRLLDRAFESEQ